MQITAIEMGESGIELIGETLSNPNPLLEIIIPEIPFEYGQVETGFLMKFDRVEWPQQWKITVSFWAPSKKLLSEFSVTGSPSQAGRFPYSPLVQSTPLALEEIGIYQFRIIVEKPHGGHRQMKQKNFAVYLNSPKVPL